MQILQEIKFVWNFFNFNIIDNGLIENKLVQKIKEKKLPDAIVICVQ